MTIRLIVLLFIASFLCNVSSAQKKVVDEKAYAEWRRVDSYNLSNDGRYVTYKYVYIDNNAKNKEIEQKYYLFDNSTKKTTILDSVSNLNFSNNSRWLTYEQSGVTTLQRMRDGKIIKWNKDGSPHFEDSGDVVTYSINKGKDFVIYDLNSGDSTLLKGAQRVNFYDNGKMMIYQKETPESVDLCYGKVAKNAVHKTIFSDKNKTLNGYYFTPKTQNGSFQVADEKENKENCNLLYNFDLKNNELKLILDTKSVVVDAPLYISKNSFSKYSNRKYITFEVYQTEPQAKKKVDKSKKDDSFELELWSWDDSISQGIQGVSGYREAKVNPYLYVYNAEMKKSYPLLVDSYSALYTSTNIESDYIFISDERPYSKLTDWEHDQRFDLYLVDLRNGEKKLFQTRTTTRATWSKNGDYIVYYDAQAKAWMSLEPKTFTLKNISESIGHSVCEESYDKPNPKPSYGLTGWSSDGKSILINDEYDIWVVDVSGAKPAYCYTQSYGRKNSTMIRLVNPNYSDITVDLSKSYDVNMLDVKTMNSAIGTITPDGKIVKNIEGAYAHRIIKNSNDNKTYLYQQQSFSSDRDIWISDSKFKKRYKITNANPQQKDYKWGSVEIVEWTNYENKPNGGLLFLPEDYQKGKSYPAIVNFYETHTGEKHIYHAPSYSAAMLDVATYVSNGYIVFMPDVNFKIGEPGKSSYNAVVSGTKALIERGILDANRIGLQGHSWSGYQTAYLVTKTDIFKCVNIGAPIVNMTHAYNGIREGSGMPRMFMYEDWQCRMGSTMWDALDKYIESSPILYADKIKTPVLLFHCDNDEAVSFYEGRSLFLALRRLQQPAWLLNYKGEGHFVNKAAAQADWTKRMRQFFDYYLNDTAMPRWMSEGININERGYDQKYDLIKK